MAVEVGSFFERWRQHLPSAEPIGALLSLFSSPAPMARLAGNYFQSRSVADVRLWIEENYGGVLAKLAHEFQQQIPNIEVQRGATTRVRSLLGTTLDARRQEKP